MRRLIGGRARWLAPFGLALWLVGCGGAQNGPGQGDPCARFARAPEDQGATPPQEVVAPGDTPQPEGCEDE